MDGELIGASASILSSLTMALVFISYNKNLIQGKVRPNLTSWALFALITNTTFMTLHAVSKDWIATAVILTDALCVSTTFGLLILKGVRSPFAPIGAWEKLAAGLGLAALALFVGSPSGGYANLAILAAFTAAYIPTYLSVWQEPTGEKLSLWVAWSALFFLGGTLAALLRGEGGWALLTPTLYSALALIVAVELLVKRAFVAIPAVQITD